MKFPKKKKKKKKKKTSKQMIDINPSTMLYNPPMLSPSNESNTLAGSLINDDEIKNLLQQNSNLNLSFD